MRNRGFNYARTRLKVRLRELAGKDMDHQATDARASPAVLVVENDILERLATAAGLRRLGFEVLEAADITEAKTILGTVAVDVLFSNVCLIDGEQLAQWVKQQGLPTRLFWVADAEDQPVRNPRPC